MPVVFLYYQSSDISCDRQDVRSHILRLLQNSRSPVRNDSYEDKGWMVQEELIELSILGIRPASSMISATSSS